MDCSPPGFSAHGIFQVRILEWVAISFSRGSSWLKDRTCISCIGRRILDCWATRGAWLKPYLPFNDFLNRKSFTFLFIYLWGLYWICCNIASVLCFVFFGPEACGILVPWPGIKPAPQELEGRVLTTGPAGKSLPPLKRRGPWGPEKLTDLPRITQLNLNPVILLPKTNVLPTILSSLLAFR